MTPDNGDTLEGCYDFFEGANRNTCYDCETPPGLTRANDLWFS